MLWKYCTQYASKSGKLNSGQRTGKGLFSFQSQRKAMPKNVQTTAQLHSHVAGRLFFTIGDSREALTHLTLFTCKLVSLHTDLIWETYVKEDIDFLNCQVLASSHLSLYSTSEFGSIYNSFLFEIVFYLDFDDIKKFFDVFLLLHQWHFHYKNSLKLALLTSILSSC